MFIMPDTSLPRRPLGVELSIVMDCLKTGKPVFGFCRNRLGLDTAVAAKLVIPIPAAGILSRQTPEHIFINFAIVNLVLFIYLFI